MTWASPGHRTGSWTGGEYERWSRRPELLNDEVVHRLLVIDPHGDPVSGSVQPMPVTLKVSRTSFGELEVDTANCR